MGVTWIALQLKDVESDSKCTQQDVGCLSEDRINI